jgi:hypothetical protein
MRRTWVSALIVLFVLAVGGCGEDEKEPIPLGDDAKTSSSEPSPDASSSPSADESSPDETPFDDKGNEAIRGKVEADTPVEQAIADTWFAYWEARANSFHKVKVDPSLGSVAAGQAVADVVRYVAYLEGEKLRTVGDTRFSVEDIVVKGSTATLTSCGVNKSIDRRADGSPAEQPVPFYNFVGALKQAGGVWRVTVAEVKGNNGCRA